MVIRYCSHEVMEMKRHYGAQFILGLKASDCHTYTIRWLLGRTERLMEGAVVVSDSAQPDMDTPVRLNFWAPASG